MKKGGQRTLPEYDSPPLIEVVLDVQFEPLERLLIPQMGALWQRLKDRIESVEQRPPLEPNIERFGIPAGARAPRIQMMQSFPVPRVWFVETGQRDLVQVQQDRFIRNWRSMSGTDHYPRYKDHIRPNFIRDYEDFVRFLEDENIGHPKPVQCEITYINHILPCDAWHSHADIGRLFKFWQDPAVTTDMDLEEVRCTLNYVLKQNGEPAGRLRITAEPALRAEDKAPMYALRLTARGQPLGEDLEGILKFFDLGREKIVRTFTNITSEPMHKTWGLKDG